MTAVARADPTRFLFLPHSAGARPRTSLAVAAFHGRHAHVIPRACRFVLFSSAPNSKPKGTSMAEQLDARAAGARRLAGKVCVVTGAGQGIGRAAARRLGQEGGKIVVADRVDESATETVSELRDHGVEATKVLVDLATFAGAQDLMTQAKKAYGRVDVLVNNVGGTIWIKPFHLYSAEEVELE